ncbi:MAG: helix-turn-helix domain-containing protein [Aureispira sp.]
MSFGERLMLIRKRKKLSQAEVGKRSGILGDTYGKYERGEVKPTIEVAVRISRALETSLDYLVNNTDIELDSDLMKKLETVSKMSDEDKGHVLAVLDAFVAKDKIQKL